ncbi:hypothetical protein D3C87_1619850 [compost metagenome]
MVRAPPILLLHIRSPASTLACAFALDTLKLGALCCRNGNRSTGPWSIGRPLKDPANTHFLPACWPASSTSPRCSISTPWPPTCPSARRRGASTSHPRRSRGRWPSSKTLWVLHSSCARSDACACHPPAKSSSAIRAASSRPWRRRSPKSNCCAGCAPARYGSPRPKAWDCPSCPA